MGIYSYTHRGYKHLSYIRLYFYKKIRDITIDRSKTDMADDSLYNKIDTEFTIDRKMLTAEMMALADVLENSQMRTVFVEPAIADKYRFDFEGLITLEFNVPRVLIPLTLYINGLTSSTQYDGSMLAIRIVDESELSDYLLKINRTES